MADKLTSSHRSHCMSRIRGKNTKPEILVRKGLDCDNDMGVRTSY